MERKFLLKMDISFFFFRHNEKTSVARYDVEGEENNHRESKCRDIIQRRDRYRLVSRYRQSAGFKIVVVLRIIQSLPLCSLRIRVSSRYSFFSPPFLHSPLPHTCPRLFLLFSFFFPDLDPFLPLALLLSRSLVGKSELRVYTLLVRSISTNPSSSSPLSLSFPHLLSPPASRRRSSEGCQLPWG